MIYPNGQRVLAASPRAVSGALAQSGALGYGGIRGARFNHFVSETYNKITGAVPSGYGQRAFVMPIDAGGLVGFTGLTFAQSATGGLGLPGTGVAEMTFTVSDADGQLISSGSGTAEFAISCADLLLTASLGGEGTASFEITAANALLGAEANLTGETTFTFTGGLTPYAIGNMVGTTDVATSVVNANIVSVNGYTVTGNGQIGSEWGPS
jgi:hypothetical protein